jgi:hypothetical protein
LRKDWKIISFSYVVKVCTFEKTINMDNLTKPEIKRLYSLDALRGFDMFWIMGGEGIFIGLASLTGWPVLK